MATTNQAWVTLATNDPYAVGALVLAKSLRRAKTTKKIVIMVTSGVSQEMRVLLTSVCDDVVDVDLLDTSDAENLQLLDRPDLGVTLTKLHCWKLTNFEKCVFLDADTLVIKNSDELFDREEFSAAPDAGWPDCFNSGVFVFKPSLDTYKALLQHSSDFGSFDGGDQGLLNDFFSTWATHDISKHLPFLYNMCATATYSYLPAYKKFGHMVKIVHFIGATKPWHIQFDSQGKPIIGQPEAHAVNHLKQWWYIFNKDVRPEMDTLTTHLATTLTLDSPQSQGPSLSASISGPMASFPVDDGDERSEWELGNPDYMGRASFDNILKKIDSSLASPKTDP